MISVSLCVGEGGGTIMGVQHPEYQFKFKKTRISNSVLQFFRSELSMETLIFRGRNPFFDTPDAGPF